MKYQLKVTTPVCTYEAVCTSLGATDYHSLREICSDIILSFDTTNSTVCLPEEVLKHSTIEIVKAKE